jgi:hypothetical protein
VDEKEDDRDDQQYVKHATQRIAGHQTEKPQQEQQEYQKQHGTLLFARRANLRPGPQV